MQVGSDGTFTSETVTGVLDIGPRHLHHETVFVVRPGTPTVFEYLNDDFGIVSYIVAGKITEEPK